VIQLKKVQYVVKLLYTASVGSYKLLYDWFWYNLLSVHSPIVVMYIIQRYIARVYFWVLSCHANRAKLNCHFLQPSSFLLTTQGMSVWLVSSNQSLFTLPALLRPQKRKRSMREYEKGLGERTRSSVAEKRPLTWDYQLVQQE